MKQNPTPTEIKAMIKQELKNYTTKEELQKILNHYPTQKDLSEKMTTSQHAFRAEIRYEFSLIREDLQTTLSTFASRIFTAIDPLLAELENRQQDREIANAQMKDVQIRLDEHESRLKHLEHS